MREIDATEQAYKNGYEKGVTDCKEYVKEVQDNLDAIVVSGCSCVSNAVVYGLKNSIRGAKFPMSVDLDSLNSDLTDGIKKLAMSGMGEGHDQWLTGITIQFDLTFSNKAWVEAERYRFLYFVSSQSTMHRITRFDLDKAYNEYVDPRIVKIMKKKVKDYNNTKDEEQKKQKYLEILYSNPAGFMLTARLTTNYRSMKTIYHQRKDHRLPEWVSLCEWMRTLPMSFLITGEEDGEMG